VSDTMTIDRIRKVKAEAEAMNGFPGTGAMIRLADTAIALDTECVKAKNYMVELSEGLGERDKRIAELCTEAETLSNRVEAKRLMHEDCERQCAELEAAMIELKKINSESAENFIKQLNDIETLEAERDRLRQQACPLKPCDYYNAALAEVER